jgi:hypothetical protein
MVWGPTAEPHTRVTSVTQLTTKTPAAVSRHAWKILGVTSLTNFVAGLDLSMANVAIPDIQRTFPTASTADVSWVLTFYMLTYAGFLITAGRVADRFGRLRVLNAGLICFVLGSSFAVWAPSLPILVAMRGIQGLGVAMMAPASLGLAVAAWPPERRGTAVAIWGSTLAASSAVGPVLGGLLIEVGSWRWAFSSGPCVLGAATVGLALAIVLGRDWGWTSPGRIGPQHPLPIAATISSNVSGRLADWYGYRSVAMLMFTIGTPQRAQTRPELLAQRQLDVSPVQRMAEEWRLPDLTSVTTMSCTQRVAHGESHTARGREMSECWTPLDGTN